jgi:hypothetical protein
VPENAAGVRVLVPTFLCPSDRSVRVREAFGPINYAVSTGSGINGGTPENTDGLFYVNSRTRFGEVLDGTSNTLAMSESLLGESGATTRNPKVAYRFVFSAPLTDRRCETAFAWNYTDPRGFSWANGEYRNGMYNHYFPPNAPDADCIGVRIGGGPSRTFAPFGWKTARSMHNSGVSISRADASTGLINNDIDLAVWRALATRAGGEIIPEF